MIWLRSGVSKRCQSPWGTTMNSIEPNGNSTSSSPINMKRVVAPSSTSTISSPSRCWPLCKTSFRSNSIGRVLGCYPRSWRFDPSLRSFYTVNRYASRSMTGTNPNRAESFIEPMLFGSQRYSGSIRSTRWRWISDCTTAVPRPSPR